MNFSLLFGLSLINLLHGKYLLVDVDNTQNNPIVPNANRCAWPPCYPPPRIDMDDTQNSQIEPKENRCRYPPCRPSATMKKSPCIPVGVIGTCVNTRQCCFGTCDKHGTCTLFARRYEGKIYQF